MGEDKALVRIDGVAMARRVATALTTAAVSDVVLVGGGDRHRALGFEVVADRYPDEGPLGGVLTALDTACRRGHGGVFVAACDLPNIGAGSIGLIIDTWRDHAETCVVARSDRSQPLCALWDRSARDVVEETFASGERAVHAVLARLPVVHVDVGDDELLNVNRPSDLGGQ